MQYRLHVRVWKAIGWRPLTLDEWILVGSSALLVADNVEVPTETDYTLAEKVEHYVSIGNEVAAREQVVRFLFAETRHVGGHTWRSHHSSTIRPISTSTVS